MLSVLILSGKAEGRRQLCWREFWFLPSARDLREQGFKTPTEQSSVATFSRGPNPPSYGTFCPLPSYFCLLQFLFIQFYKILTSYSRLISIL